MLHDLYSYVNYNFVTKTHTTTTVTSFTDFSNLKTLNCATCTAKKNNMKSSLLFRSYKKKTLSSTLVAQKESITVDNITYRKKLVPLSLCPNTW